MATKREPPPEHEVERRALGLPLPERVRLARALLSSIDEEPEVDLTPRDPRVQSPPAQYSSTADREVSAPTGPSRYRIALRESEEGFSVSVPGLPGCWSQGETEAEAIENIREAIRDYLHVVDARLREEGLREIEVSV